MGKLIACPFSAAERSVAERSVALVEYFFVSRWFTVVQYDTVVQYVYSMRGK